MSATIHTTDFRDTLSTSDKQGGRIWIYPKILRGQLYRFRMVFAYTLIGLFLIGPFLEYNGHPLFLINILERKFILFGVPFWPQDMPIFAISLITFVVFISVFTVAFGRLWCGWACPQTVFMEMVFRPIEALIEGDFRARKKLDEAPTTFEKIWKKTLKHGIFLLISFIVANTLLAYFIGKRELWKLISEGPMVHWGKLAGLLIFTTVFYTVFAKLRELACIIVCPYGRLQSVLLDKHSITVAYDYKRGEPRGHIKKGQDNSHLGDCVDCKLCIDVCPTGIDIRNGLQMECVHCTACIDACDSVMTKIGKPTGLIRYDSEYGIASSVRKRFTWRLAAYSAVLTVLLGILLSTLFGRSKVEATILRTPGLSYQEQENGYISNLYNVEIINKTFDNLTIDIQTSLPEARIKWVGAQQVQIPEAGMYKGALFVEVPKANLHRVKNEFNIYITQNGNVLDKVHTSFLAPGN